MPVSEINMVLNETKIIDFTGTYQDDENHDIDIAMQYSKDGSTWEFIPNGIFMLLNRELIQIAPT
jgi:hypothetical protein